MSNIAKREAAVQAASASLPALVEQCNEIDQFMKKYRELRETLHGHFYTIDDEEHYQQGRPWKPLEVQQAKEIEAELPAKKQLWAVLSRPATKDQIATLSAKLVASFPNVNNVDGSNYFAEAIIEEVDAEGPLSLYVMQRVVSRVRRKNEFLSVKVVVDEIELASNRAKRLEERLNDDQLAYDIIAADLHLGLITAEEAKERNKRLGWKEPQPPTRAELHNRASGAELLALVMEDEARRLKEHEQRYKEKTNHE